MSDNFRKPHIKKILIFSAAGVALLALITVIVVAAIGNKRKRSGGDDAGKGRLVLTADNVGIYENQFRFFATLVLDQESTVYALTSGEGIDRNATLKNSVLNFSKEYIFRLREAENAGFSLSDEERRKVLTSIGNEYEQFRTVGGKVYEGDSFYDYYYGLTEEQYRTFWLDWALIEKYNAAAAAGADVSEGAQSAAFDFYRQYLAGRECTVFSLKLAGLTAEKAETARTLARELDEQLKSGADAAKMAEKYCEDDYLRENGFSLVLTESLEPFFPELYAWAAGANEGDSGTVETGNEIFIIKAGKNHDFDALKNTGEMIEWTKAYASEKLVSDLLASGKYSYTINDGVYNTLDLEPMIERALDSYADYYS